MDALIPVLLVLSPVIGFVAGFCAGTIRIAFIRAVAAILVILLPLALLIWPLLVPWSTQGDRYGAAFGLVLLGIPLALWMLFAPLGVVVGSARRCGSQ